MKKMAKKAVLDNSMVGHVVLSEVECVAPDGMCVFFFFFFILPHLAYVMFATKFCLSAIIRQVRR
jgi:hypothetical protein